MVTIFYYSNNTEGHFNDPKGQQYSVRPRSILYKNVAVTVRNAVERLVNTITFGNTPSQLLVKCFRKNENGAIENRLLD